MKKCVGTFRRIYLHLGASGIFSALNAQVIFFFLLLNASASKLPLNVYVCVSTWLTWRGI